jgi:ArsR family transcriptional regulator
MTERFRAQPEIVFKALGDETRQGALAVLARQELGVSELVEVLHRPQSTVSRHLKVLRDAGLIRDRRDGNTVLYSVTASTSSRDANDSDLPSRLLHWIAEQPIPPTVKSRLDAVMQRRAEMSRRFFDRIGRQWDALRDESFGSRFYLEAFLALLPEEWTVADIGTGTGYLLPTLAGHFRQVIGVESVAAMLEAARRRMESWGLPNVELCNADLAYLPIAGATVDLAIAVLVLHHVPAPGEALAELRRIVRPGGCVLIVEQTAHESETFRDRMQDRWWGFEMGEFGRLLQSVGFQEVRLRPLTTVERGLDAPDLFVAMGR